jgi:predicted helicase
MNVTNNIFQQINKFSDVYILLKNQTNEIKGLFLEHFTKHFFKTHHLYKGLITEVYLYNEIPASIKKELKLPNKDKGIDLLIKYNNEWTAVQCKYRQDPKTIVAWNELATFFGLSFGINTVIKKGFYVTNTYDLIDEVIKSDKVIPISGNFLHNLNKDFFENIRKNINGEKIVFNKTIPFDCQKEAILKAVQHYKNNKLGYMEVICGAGKTKTAYWIKYELAIERLVIFVPSLMLLSQFYDEWRYEMEADRDNAYFLLIGSDYDDSLDEKYINRLDNLSLTTDPATIADKIMIELDLVVICTYQSASILSDVCKALKYKFEFGIFDEAHKTVGQSDKKFSMCLENDNINISKKMFMTATPKIYAGKMENDEIISMDNETIYGKCFYTYNMYQAIADKRLCDYQILTMHTTNNYIDEILKENKLVSLKDNYQFDDKIKALYIASAIIIFKCINSHNCTHMLTYHNSVKNAQNFCKLLKEINKILYKKDMYIDCIDGNHSMNNRRNTIREFEKSKIGIICCAKVLNEGVNIPIVDSECFVDPRSSTIDIIQCIGRAIRLYEGKDFAKIIIPIISDQIGYDIPNMGLYENVIKILKSLNTTDKGIVEYFVAQQKGENIIGGRAIVKTEYLYNEKIAININLNDWTNKINLLVWNKVDSFYTSFIKFQTWVNAHDGKMPSTRSNNSDEIKLSNWAACVRKINRENRLDKSKIMLFNVFDKWYWNEDEKFESNINNLIKWMNTHDNKIPLKSSIDREEARIGEWCYLNRCNYKNNVLTTYKIEQFEKIIGWKWTINDITDELFNKKYTKLELWVKTNGRLPSSDAVESEEKTIGQWIHNKKTDYKTGKLTDNQIKKLEIINGWCWNIKDKIFSENYNKLKVFIKNNNIIPTVTSKDINTIKLAQWCTKLRGYYKQGILSEEHIILLENIPKWFWIKHNTFNDIFDKLKIWVADNGKIPTNNPNNQEEYKLNIWCATQRKQYKLNKLDETKIKLLELLPNWYWSGRIKKA